MADRRDKKKNRAPSDVRRGEDALTRDPLDRQPYEPPTVVKKRSVRRVTLFSGTGTAGAGLFGGG